MTSLAGDRSSGSKSSKKNAKTKGSAGPPALPFEVRRSPIQGLGGFATRRIAKGTRIVEYVGEIISDAEADRRYDDDKMSRHHTFLFSLGDGTSIDAAVNGNEARFINHSCAPNCEAINEDGRIFIETLRAIEPGEELFYDYSYELGGDADDADERAEMAEFYACKCGAPACRGTILAPPKEKKRKKAATRKKAAPAKKGTTSTTSKTQKKGPVSKTKQTRSKKRG